VVTLKSSFLKLLATVSSACVEVITSIADNIGASCYVEDITSKVYGRHPDLVNRYRISVSWICHRYSRSHAFLIHDLSPGL
jgi:hypothetical protein